MQVKAKKRLTPRQQQVQAAAADQGCRVSDIVRAITESLGVHEVSVYRVIAGSKPSKRIERAICEACDIETLESATRSK